MVILQIQKKMVASYRSVTLKHELVSSTALELNTLLVYNCSTVAQIIYSL